MTTVIPSALQASGARPPPRVPDHELLRCIGQGSYGEVWLARNLMDQWRAVKVVHRQRFAGDEHLYEREFEGIRRYEPVSRSHESLMQVLHVGRDATLECFFYVMELADADRDAAVPDSGDAVPGSSVPLPLENPEAYVPRTLRAELKRRGRLPPEECARIGASLATALAQLHGHKLVHRDIKPSNVIFAAGRPKLADIGLVTALDASRSFVGTMGYVAPEGPGTPAADIFALGKVLYEMATGRDRFDYPSLPPMGQLDRREQQGVRELNAVLLKACADDAKQRHRDAGELRDELLRLQLGESIERQRTIERAYGRLKWASRWAGGALLIGAALVAVWNYRSRAALREAESLLHEAALSRAGMHEAGWVSANRALIRRAAALSSGQDVRTEGAGALAGLDAWPVTNLWNASAGSAAFARDGTLLIGGSWGSNGLWMRTNGVAASSGSRSEGPVCWTPEGVALVLAAESNAIVLREVASGHIRRSIPLADGERVNRSIGPALAMTPDGQCVAVALVSGSSQRVVAWESTTGRLLGETNWSAVTLALSPDGSTLAAGDSNGIVHVASLPGLLHSSKLPPPKPGRVQSLALSRNRVVPDAQNGRTNGWLLAAAYKGGGIILWDLAAGLPTAFCRGSSYTVTALAFDTDGLTLASAGRGEARLWDSMTGKLLLSLNGGGGGNARALAFNADGTRLVWGTEGQEDPPCVSLRELNWHRGIRVLRGLRLNPRKVWFSPDSRRLAALSDDWIVAVWNTDSGRLASMFEVPAGVYADNAGGAFHPEGRHFAFASGTAARLFDVETGQVVGRWELDPGLMDHLQYDPQGQLWLVRRGPDTVPPTPQRWRREQLRFDGTILRGPEQTDTNWAAYTIGFAPGAQRFFVGTQDTNTLRPTVRMFDSSGSELKEWIVSGLNDVTPHFNPTGTWFYFVTNAAERGQWGRASDAALLGATPEHCAALGAAGSFAISDRRGYIVRDNPRRQLDLPLGQDWMPSAAATFSPDGRFFAWGSMEGVVLLADLEHVRQQLDALK